MPPTSDSELLIQALAALDAVRLADLGYHIDLPDIIRQHLARPADACADLDAIRAKAETFFEWDTDRRDHVTYTSCLLFARQCVEDWRAAPTQDGAWQPVATAPTDTPLLATYLDEAGQTKIIRAELIGRFTQPAEPDWETCPEYNEATDTYYRAAGWVEKMDHWDDHDGCYIASTIIGWMPLPQPMEAP